MKYLSIDLESTGLDENCIILEFAMIPFSCETKTIEEKLARHFFIKCPSLEELRPTLNHWVVEHNSNLINKAHSEGITLEEFRSQMKSAIESDEYRNYFEGKKIVLFGKSMNAIDLPFLSRDLGWNFMRDRFSHRIQDLSSVAYNLIDMKLLPPEAESGSELMRLLKMGEVAHTALEDARNTAIMYLKLLSLFEAQKGPIGFLASKQ